ncbi:hypothetical protein WA026_023766 [Henosepilachna vigintioctopunctata]|uniref:BRICHOS domain-containing protein n=1 Tax=Henosepilachna vigintioctopunctata TaxID=420089 RepID=A0AAW1UQW6_9CUCU
MARMLRKYMLVVYFCCLPYLGAQEKLDNNVRKLSGDDDDIKKSTTIYDYHTRMTAYKDLVGSGCYIEFIKNGEPTLSQRIREFPMKKLPNKLYISEEKLSKRRIWELAGSRILEFCRGFPTYLIQEVQSKNLNDISTDNDIMKSRMRRRRSTRHYFVGRLRGQTQSQYLNFGHSNNSSGKAEAESTFGTSRASVVGTNGMGQAQSQSSAYDCDECYRPIKNSEYVPVGRPGMSFRPGELTSEREQHIGTPKGPETSGIRYPTGISGNVPIQPDLTHGTSITPEEPSKVEGGYPPISGGANYPTVSSGRPGESGNYPMLPVSHEFPGILPNKPGERQPGLPGRESYPISSQGEPVVTIPSVPGFPLKPDHGYPAIYDQGKYSGNLPSREQDVHQGTAVSLRPQGIIEEKPKEEAKPVNPRVSVHQYPDRNIIAGHTKPESPKYPTGIYPIGPSEQIPERTGPVQEYPGIRPSYPSGQPTYPGSYFQNEFPAKRYPGISEGDTPASFQNVYPGIHDRTQGYPDKFVPSPSISGTPGRFGGDIAGNYQGNGHTGRFSGQFSGVFDINGQRISQTQPSSSPVSQYPGHQPTTPIGPPISYQPTGIAERPIQQPYDQRQYQPGAGWQIPLGTNQQQYQPGTTGQPVSNESGVGRVQYPVGSTGEGQYQPGYIRGKEQLQPGITTGQGQYQPGFSTSHGNNKPVLPIQEQYHPRYQPGQITDQSKFQPSSINRHEQYPYSATSGQWQYPSSTDIRRDQYQPGAAIVPEQYIPGTARPQKQYIPGVGGGQGLYANGAGRVQDQYHPGTTGGQGQYTPGPVIDQKPGGHITQQFPHSVSAGQHQFRPGGIPEQQGKYTPVTGSTVESQYVPGAGAGYVHNLPGSVTGPYIPGTGTPSSQVIPQSVTQQGQYRPGPNTGQEQNVPYTGYVQYTPGSNNVPGQFTQQGQYTPRPSDGRGQYPPGTISGREQYPPVAGTPPGQFTSGLPTQQGQYTPGPDRGQYTPGVVDGQGQYRPDIGTGQQGVTDRQNQQGFGKPGIYQPGADLSPTPSEQTYDDGDSQVQASVQQMNNETQANAQAQGKFEGGTAQSQVSGTYSGSGSFSASAGSDDGKRGALSQVSGGKQGATSSAQGRGGKGKSQAQMQLFSDTGKILSTAQSGGPSHSSQTQVQGGEDGGMANAQSNGSGRTSSQAQIGFSPYKKTTNVNNAQKNFFLGGGTASAQGGSTYGLSQSQIQGQFQYGIKYTGGAQAQSGSSVNRNFSFTPFIPAVQIKPISLIPQSLTKNEETNLKVDGSHNTSTSILKENKNNATNGIDDKHDQESSTVESSTDGEDIGEYDYEENDTENPTSNKVITQTRDGQTQHIVLPHMRNLDANVVQTHFDDYHERVFQPGDTFQPGQLIPGTLGYRIPIGFRAKVKSVASPSETYALGRNSQAQTVTITPGTGKIVYQKPKNYYNGYRSIYRYKPYQNYFKSGENAMPNFLSISKSETGYENPVTGKRVSSTHFTQSSTCGLITNTCIFRKTQRICLPNITRNSDGSIRVC